MRLPALPCILCLAGVLALTACRRDEIKTYVVKKEATPAPAADPAGAATAPAATTATPAAAPTSAPAAAPATPAGPMSAAAADAQMRNTAVPTASGPGLAWSAPASWTPGPERPMRKATLLVKDAAGATAELAVTAFPGDVGGTLANVNRWRQQLSLPPISQTELGSALQHLDVGPLHIDVVELVGTGSPATRVLGAMVPYAGSTWFFKFTGPDALVTAEKANFLAFVRTIRPQG